MKYNDIFYRFLLTVIFFTFIASTVQAQIEVSSLAGDNSEGSLIAAITSANMQKTDPAKPLIIRFAKELAGEIVLSTDLPAINNHISIIGHLADNKPAITINGSVNPQINEGLKGGISPGFRLFVVNSGQYVSFENLHFTKSNQSAITNQGGVVTVNNCMFTYNMGIGSIHGTGGGIQHENGDLAVIGSYFYYNMGGVGGTDGGVGYGGAGCININGGNAVVLNSSFMENEGGFGGVGVGSIGGPGVCLVQEGANVSFVNCTAAANFGGGSIVTGASGGFIVLGGNMSLFQSTIVNNMGGAGLGGFDGVDFCSGGIHVLKGNLIVGGNIFAGNYSGADELSDIESQVSGKVHSLGYNLYNTIKVEMNAVGDEGGIELKNVVETTSEGKSKSEISSGFLPTIALISGSPAKNKSIVFDLNTFTPVISNDPNAKFFTNAWSKYALLLQSDQNGKKRNVNPSIGAIE